MPTIRTTVQPPTGLQLQDIDVTAYNRRGAAVAIGDVLQFDMAGGDAATTTIANGGGTGVFENLIVATAVGVVAYPCGVVVSLLGGAGADNTLVKVRVQGVVSATVQGTTPVAGDPLYLVSTQDELDCDAVVNQRAVGILLEDTTSGSQGSVYFDGINGVGLGPVA